jgi:hypothetical protein
VSRYAENTNVSVEASRAEIERTLTRYGASSFMYGWTGEAAIVQFIAEGRHVKFILKLPDRNDKRFTHFKRGTRYVTQVPRTPEAALKEWEQGCRQRWRALALCIKAKLEAVESGISTFEDEFLAQIVLPDGKTAGEWLRPQVDEAYRTGSMPAMLPALGTG